jgi:hypothetical protein
MGNLSYIVPIERQELATNVQALADFLKKKHPEFHYAVSKEWSQINVFFAEPECSNKDIMICSIYVDDDGHCVYDDSIAEDLIYLKEMLPKMVADYNKFLEAGGTRLSRLAITYGNDPKMRREIICKTIFRETKAFWFDEGIHPEFIPPGYKFKDEGYQ